MTKNFSKYPKNLANAEIMPRNKQQENSILNIENEMLKAKIAELDKGAFQLGGFYPFIFDTINFVCTHYKEFIQRQDNTRETHYRLNIPIEHFLSFALDGSMYKKRLYDEMYRLIKSPVKKSLPLDKKHSILTDPIRIDLIYEDDTKYSMLKNTTGKKIKNVIIEFYKPLWNRLLKGKDGEAWFLAPKAFYAKMLDSIVKWKNLPEFTKYGRLAFPINFRRLFLYLNMHDNKKGNFLNIDAIDLVRSCLPSEIQKKNNQYYIRNWFKVHKFIQKGLKLLHKMAENGLMTSVSLIPQSLWYDKNLLQIRIKICRNINQLESFQDNQKIFP